MISSGSSKPGNIPFVLFQSFFLLSVLWLPIHFGAVYLWSFAIAALFISVFFGIYLLSVVPSKEPAAVRSELDFWICVYFLVYLVSGSRSLIPSRTLMDFLKPAAAALVFFSTLYYCRTRKDIERLCLAMVFLGGGLSLFGLLQFLGALPRGWWSFKNFLSSTYVNHNHFAGLLEMVLPVSLGFSLCQDNKAKKALILFMCSLMGAAFVLTLSRGGYVSTIIGLSLWVFLLSRRGMGKKSWWVFLAFVFLVGAIVLMFGLGPIVDRLGTVKSNALGQDPYHRGFIWRGTVDLIAHYPWWGTGPGTFGSAFLKFRPAGFQYWRPMYTHNDYLNLLSDGGVFLFVVTLCLFGVIVRKALRIIDKEQGRLKIGIAAGVLAGFVSLAVHSLSDFNFHIPANFIYASVMAGMLFSLEEARYYESLLFDRLLRFSLLTLAAAVLSGSLFFGFSDYFLWRGKNAMPKPDYKSARRDFDRSLSFNPKNDEAYFQRALALSRGGDIQGSFPDFDKASSINPLEPYYDLEKANTLMGLKDLKKPDSKEAIRLYRSAVSKDPQDLHLSYFAGRGILIVNLDRDPLVEAQAIEMLRRAAGSDENRLKSLYPFLWKRYHSIQRLENFLSLTPERLKIFLGFLESEGLWKYYRKYYLQFFGISAPQPQERIVKWNSAPPAFLKLADFSATGPWTIQSGDVLFANGEVQKKIHLEDGRTRLVVRAKGNLVDGAYPCLVVTLDDKPVDLFYLNSRTYADFSTEFETSVGLHRLGLRYINDTIDRVSKKDRNVWIEKIEVRS